MCGIVGYVGNKNSKDIILGGLKSLEYRGYDSAGISVIVKNKIITKKKQGELKNLTECLKANTIVSNVGIGHTRWATHGKASETNSHPHLSYDMSISVVHNGIIENFDSIKKNLNQKGIKFKSDTDTEVIPNLIAQNYKGDLLDAVIGATKKLEGAYAFVAIHKDEPTRMVAVRKDAPLVVGLGSTENFVASDIPALLKHTKKVIFLDDNEVADVTKDYVKIYNQEKNVIRKTSKTITWDVKSAEKCGYKHFMLKEIHEQPDVLRETLERRINKKGEITFSEIKISKQFIERIDKIYISACGTAYHAGLVGKCIIEKLLRKPVEVIVASEFRYMEPVVTQNTLFITISQSGETLDTLEALREAKKRGARVLSIINVVGSSISRESDDVFYTLAGPEIAVASTKAYTTQLICLYFIALFLSKKADKISKLEYKAILKDLQSVPALIKNVLSASSIRAIKQLSKKYKNRGEIFFIGRGFDVPTAYEASLKFKEISYTNSFAIEAGELKHGTIALINNKTLVLAFATYEKLKDKLLSNAKEISARSGEIITIIKRKDVKDAKIVSKNMIVVPNHSDIITPLISIVPMQLFAYYVADEQGKPIDKPKNLAKSVTVE